jgi:dinuclear metal center YbgI/SA1388 family protein
MPAPAQLDDVVSFLRELLRVDAYPEEEPETGLVVDTGRPVGKIACAVNTSFASIRGAREWRSELLLVHHSTWSFIDLDLKPAKEEALRSAGVSLYAAHAVLDCASDFGTADSLARLLDVRVEDRFAEYGGGKAGIVGQAEGTFSAFAERVERALGVPVQSWENSETFGRVAIATGAGGMTNWLEEARGRGCDTYLTGEGNMYTKLFARETHMSLILGTHYATEAPGIRALAERVADEFSLPWQFIPEDPDIL